MGKIFQNEINSNRLGLDEIKFLLNLVHPLLDMFEQNLDDIEKANEIWRKYIKLDTSDTAFYLSWVQISKKYYTQFKELVLEHNKKLLQLMAIQNADPDVKTIEYHAINTLLPTKALFEIYRKNVLDMKN